MSPLAVHCLLQSSGDLNNEVTDNPHVSLSPSDGRWRGHIRMAAGDQVVTNNFGDRSSFGVSTASYSIFHSEMRLSGTAALRSTLA